MKKYFLISLSALTLVLFSSISLNAQQNAPINDINEVIINPTMPIINIVFAINALNTITIQGAEVDTFLEAKGILEKEINRCAELKKKTNETTTFSIKIGKAQHILDFLKRAKLTGNDAVLYKGFVNSFVEASKKANPNNK
mgnify:CR=1 FL=1